MDKLMQLGYDMSRLWAKYWPDYMTGIRNTLIVAVIATLVGCIIGLICGILNTIPYTKSDRRGQAVHPEADPGDRPHLRGGLPRHAL